MSFENEEVPSILGFKGIRDISNPDYFHIGYNPVNEGNSLNRNVGDFPVDITFGSQLIFVYIDITEHQNVGDVRAPVIKIIESERRLRNGSMNTVTPTHHKSYTNLNYKPILSNNIQNIQIELRNETGKLILFTKTGKIIVSLKFQRIMWYRGILLQSSISINGAFFRTLQTKRQRFWSAFCRYLISLARSEKDWSWSIGSGSTGVGRSCNQKKVSKTSTEPQRHRWISSITHCIRP